MTLPKAAHETKRKNSVKNKVLLCGFFSDSSDSSVYDLRDSSLALNQTILFDNSQGSLSANEAGKETKNVRNTLPSIHSPISQSFLSNDELFNVQVADQESEKSKVNWASDIEKISKEKELLKRRMSSRIPAQPKRRRKEDFATESVKVSVQLYIQSKPIREYGTLIPILSMVYSFGCSSISI